MAMIIPRLIHQIWLGSPVPDRFLDQMADWALLNPGWNYNLWTQPLPDMANLDLYENANEIVKPDAVWQFRADLLRYEILYRYGGFYADVDTKPLRPLGNLFDNRAEWAVAEDDTWVGNTYLAAVQYHPVFEDAIEMQRGWLLNREWPLAATVASGPQYLTHIWNELDCYADPNTSLWFPYSWRHVKRGTTGTVEIPADAYAVHQFNHQRERKKTYQRTWIDQNKEWGAGE